MKVLTFGIIKEIVGKHVLELNQQISTVSELEEYLKKTYPKLEQLNSMMIAVNQEYSDKDQSLDGTEEIALIPPVSGG